MQLIIVIAASFYPQIAPRGRPMTAPNPMRRAGNEVVLPGQSASAPRSLDAIRADFLAVAETVKVLTAEWEAVMAGGPNVPARRLVSLKEASRQTEWRVSRIREHMQRRATHHPELPQIGFQPGNVANSPWFVNLDVTCEPPRD